MLSRSGSRGSRRPGRLVALALAAAAMLLPGVSSAQINRYLVLFTTLTPTGRYAGDYDINLTDVLDDGTREFLAEKPKAISAQSYREFSPVAVPDGTGGAFVAYTVEHIDSLNRGDRDILMRRIDRMGNDVWGDSSRRFVVIAESKHAEENPRIVPTSDGGLIVFYEVHYRTGADTNDVDIAAVKLGGDGATQWPGGVWIANTNKREHLTGVASDGLGGALAVFELATVKDSVIASDIYAAHVDRAGKVGWGASPAPLAIAASKHLERNAATVGDGYGGLYVAYELEYTSGDRTGDVDILAQHVSSYGVREWIDPSALPIVSSDDKAREHSPVIALDSTGVVVAFEVSIAGPRQLSLIGVQHMDHLGKATWNLGRKATLFGASDRTCSTPLLVPLPAGGTYLLFEGRDSVTGNRDLYAQKLSADGDGVWGSGEQGVPIFSTGESERDASATLDALGGLMVVASKSHPTPDGFTASDIVAQRVNADGTLAWQDLPGPLQLTNSPLQNLSPIIIPSR